MRIRLLSPLLPRSPVPLLPLYAQSLQNTSVAPVANNHVSDVLAEVFKRGGMKRAVRRAEAVLLWRQVVGPEVAKFTEAKSLSRWRFICRGYRQRNLYALDASAAALFRCL